MPWLILCWNPSNHTKAPQKGQAVKDWEPGRDSFLHSVLLKEWLETMSLVWFMPNFFPLALLPWNDLPMPLARNCGSEFRHMASPPGSFHLPGSRAEIHPSPYGGRKAKPFTLLNKRNNWPGMKATGTENKIWWCRSPSSAALARPPAHNRMERIYGKVGKSLFWDSLMVILRKNLQAFAATEWKNTLATKPELLAKRNDSLLTHK